MKRLNIFAKGNLDVHDTLHSLEVDGTVTWNGINQLLRENGAGLTIRIKHETAIGCEAALAAPGKVPDAFAGHDPRLGPYPLPIQFGRSLFDFKADAYVLSIQPEVMVTTARHRQDGYIFHPYEFRKWEKADREWLMREFIPDRIPDADASMAHFERLITELRTKSDAPILIYNMSSLVPGETVHCHAGLEDIFSTRIKRFNLALIELSQRTGISIVDVDRIVAERGADAMKFDTSHLNERGCRAVAGEVLRILTDLGCIPEAEVSA